MPNLYHHLGSFCFFQNRFSLKDIRAFPPAGGNCDQLTPGPLHAGQTDKPHQRITNQLGYKVENRAVILGTNGVSASSLGSGPHRSAHREHDKAVQCYKVADPATPHKVTAYCLRKESRKVKPCSISPRSITC